MAKIKEEKEEKVLTPGEQALAYLKVNKKDNYNFEKTIDYKVPSSSFIFNAVTGGGIGPGAHRFVGVTSGGKTACSLDFMFNFLLEESKDRYGIYVKSEGRLSNNVKERSGIRFVNFEEFANDPTKWAPGTCLVIESNVYEFVFGFIGNLIRNNETGAKYFFIIDSMDMMGKRDDLEKPLEEAGQVAGGALLTSVFLKKTSVALAKRGHIIAFLSQVRDEIKLNPYAGGGSTPRQGKSSGGHALEHAPDWVFEFKARNADDIIRESDSKTGKPIGHYCKIRIVKSDNETYNQDVRYPIAYGRKGAKSVWVEKELGDMVIGWELAIKKGSWYTFEASLFEEAKAIIPDLPEKFQGEDRIYTLIDKYPAFRDLLKDKFSSLID